MSNPTPKDYAELFEDDRRGAAILMHLTDLFAKRVYVKGGHEADRQTCYNAGQRDVIEFIVAQLNRHHGADPNEEQDHAH